MESNLFVLWRCSKSFGLGVGIIVANDCLVCLESSNGKGIISLDGSCGVKWGIHYWDGCHSLVLSILCV